MVGDMYERNIIQRMCGNDIAVLVQHHVSIAVIRRQQYLAVLCKYRISDLRQLSGREREIVQMRFGLAGCRELTQKEVADRMGISQSYISRLEKKIIGRLQKEIKKLG